MHDLEANIDATIASLKAGLPTRIAAVNAVKTDLVLAVPDDANYYAGGLETFVAYPSVEVAGPDWSYASPSIAQYEWDGATSIMVRLLAEHPDFQTLYRSMMRYTACLVEVLAQPGAFGDNATLQRMRGFYRTNPEQGTREEFLGGSLVVCSVETVEIIPT
jgi:hypothetical protein